ncbi:MAG: DUF1992 domain-containing protein [Nocardioidaceae bacterium]|nr:DUF1992 domain-containing protein [Nocardioidaceae bacterium]
MTDESRPDREPARDKRTGRAAAGERMRNQTRYVDLEVQRAIERGEFDNLPGAGKPLKLPDRHDPDWWLKQFIERENISGVAPPAIMLRTEDAQLDDALDQEPTEDAVRRTVEDFNRRVVEARRQLQGGPPVVTPTRDPDTEVDRWRTRRRARLDAHRAEAREVAAEKPSRRAFWRRRRAG